MRLEIHIANKEPFKLEVEPYYSARTIKRKIEYLYDIPAGQQTLYRGIIFQEFAGTGTLSERGVQNEENFTIEVNEAYFFLSCAVGPKFTLQVKVKLFNTVKELKELISNHKNMPPRLQRILLNEIELKDEYHLVDYKINSDSTVVVIPDYKSIIDSLENIALIN